MMKPQSADACSSRQLPEVTQSFRRRTPGGLQRRRRRMLCYATLCCAMLCCAVLLRMRVSTTGCSLTLMVCPCACDCRSGAGIRHVQIGICRLPPKALDSIHAGGAAAAVVGALAGAPHQSAAGSRGLTPAAGPRGAQRSSQNQKRVPDEHRSKAALRCPACCGSGLPARSSDRQSRIHLALLLPLPRLRPASAIPSQGLQEPPARLRMGW